MIYEPVYSSIASIHTCSIMLHCAPYLLLALYYFSLLVDAKMHLLFKYLLLCSMKLNLL